MNTRAAEFDIGPLTWVKGEIDQSLDRAREALKKFAANPADATQLKFSQTHLHQAHGALQIVGLDGVTRMSEELESLLGNLERETLPRTPDLFTLAERGFAAVSVYLDQLMTGAPNQPLRLFAIYSELLAKRGGEADPSDLYFPDLSHRPPRRAEPARQLHSEEAPKYYREQRGKFQRALLKWLKKDPAGPLEMREAIAAVEATQQLPAQRAFWWVATAFCEALIHDAFPPGVDAKRLCTRIEQQLKRMIDGTPNVAERLMREALYFVAQAKPASDLLRQVHDTYGLEGSLPAADAAGTEALPEQPLLRGLHDQVTQAKDVWNKYFSGHQPSLAAFRDLTVTVKERAASLPKTDVAALARDIAAVAVWLNDNAQAMGEAVAMEVATSLLLLDNALENYARLDAEYTQQAQLMGARLKACMLGQAPTTPPEIPMLDEMSRRAQERLVMHQVMTEIQANLRIIEQALDAFFRDTAKRGDLATLDKAVRQVLGALAMLGEARAAETLAACQREIVRFARDDYEPRQADFEHVAQQLSGLGFYVEALGHGKADFDIAMQPIKPPSPETAMERTQRIDGSVEAELELQKKDTASLFEALKETPGDPAIKEELKQNLEAIKQDAGLVADAELQSQAGEALSMLDETGAMPLLTAAIEGIAPPPSIDEPSPEAAKLIGASDETVDAELLSVYLEEAEEVLGNINNEMATSKSQPQNQDAMTTIRRGFHTLKGSGRMVGLTRLGEAAWAVEQVMNLWLQDARPATPELLRLIQEAHDYFLDNVGRLKQGGQSSDEHALVAMAEKMLQAGSPADAVAAEPAPPAPSAPTIEISIAASPATPGAETPLPTIEIEVPAPDAAAGASEYVVSDAAEEEQSIVIGEITVSPSLYGIFLSEVGTHVTTMKNEVETLHDHGVVSDAFLRAAHTMAGISGTIRLDDMRDLGYSLERALQQISLSPAVGDEEQTLIEQSVRALDAMRARVAERLPPDAAPELVARLELATEAAAAATQAAQLEATASATSARALEAEDLEQAEFAALAEAESAAPTEMEPVIPEEAQIAAPPEPELPAIEMPAIEMPEIELPSLDELPPSAADIEVEEMSLERRSRRLDDDLDPELLPVFLEEAAELVPSVGTTLREWRADTANPSHGQNMLRLLHTLKGSARMAGAMALGELTHNIETRIENAMQMKTLSAALFDDLEVSYDRMSFLYEALQNPDLLLTELEPAEAALPEVQAEALPTAEDHEAAAAAMAAPREGEAPHAPLPREGEAQRAGILRVRADLIDRLVNQAGEVSIARSRIEGEMRTAKTALGELTDNVHRLRAQLREVEIQAETQMQSQMAMAHESKKGFDALEFDRFTRFQELTRMMAESVNDVGTVHLNLLDALDETSVALVAQSRMNRDLQTDLMRIRMVPFASVSERLYRVARLTAKELGKRANLDIRGGQVEMDRSVLERITAPFEHLLRNSITHGLEPAAERSAKGKPEIGDIKLHLRQEGNDVVLILSDDGAGLNLARIRDKAISQGLLQADAQPTDAELSEFIFRPGFSTATEITQIAGRGVGMDVVRNEITALGGRVELKSEPDKGARFTIFLPLTLAVTQAVLIRAGGRMFAVPAVMVEQVMQLRPKDFVAIKESGHAEWQGRRHVLHYLPELLALEHELTEPRRTIPILFIRSGVDVVAIEVDEMIGNQEIVVKNVGAHIARIAGITGATVLGTGEIVLILNPVALAQRPALSAADAAARAPVAVQKVEEVVLPTIMVVDDSLTVRKITGRLLTREGYQCVTAKDGVDALEQLQEMVPDVMLVDIEMPRMDGFDLSRNVRADPRLKHIPIIMITSRTADKHRTYAKEIGVNVYLGKPYQEDELLAHIAGFLAEAKAKAEAKT